MLFGPDNFLTHLKQIVTGGGRKTDGTPFLDAGYLKREEGVDLNSLKPTDPIAATVTTLTDSSGGTANDTVEAIDVTMVAVGGSGMSTAQETEYNATMTAIRNNFADLAAKIAELTVDNDLMRLALSGVADETHAKVIKVEDTVDNIGNIVWPVPRDYDENTDVLILRVLASQLTLSTDNDVELDVEMYVKTAGSALSADKDPTKPGTVLTVAEQWIEIDLTGQSLKRDDVVIIELITNGANDTDGEEVLIHAVELAYRSCIVSYDDEDDAEGNALR